MNATLSKLIITDCAAASDGGSLVLVATDSESKDVSIYLDWSIASQRVGAIQLYVNGVAVPKSSQEEDGWLKLLSDAEVKYSYGNPDEVLRVSVSTSLRGAVDEVLSRVKSKACQQGTKHQ